jgi:hypothetical protein
LGDDVGDGLEPEVIRVFDFIEASDGKRPTIFLDGLFQLIGSDRARDSRCNFCFLNEPIKSSHDFHARRHFRHFEIGQASVIQLLLPFLREIQPDICGRNISGDYQQMGVA